MDKLLNHARLVAFATFLLPIFLPFEFNIAQYLAEPSLFQNSWFWVVLIVLLGLGFRQLFYTLFKKAPDLVKAVFEIATGVLVVCLSLLLFAVSVIVHDLHSRANGAETRFQTNPAAEQYLGFMYDNVAKWFADEQFALPKTQLYFNNKYFKLAFQAEEGGFQKREFLPEGQNLETYNQMLLVDMLPASSPDFEAKQAFDFQVALLKNAETPVEVVSFETSSFDAQVGKNRPEYVLDFVLLDETEQIFEHNIYRYRGLTTDNGDKLVVAGLVNRSYNQKDQAAYLEVLASSREQIRQEFLDEDFNTLVFMAHDLF